MVRTLRIASGITSRALAAGISVAATVSRISDRIGGALYNLAKTTAIGAKLFGRSKNSILNSNRYLRIGLNRGGKKTAGHEVFRVAIGNEKWGRMFPLKWDIFKGRKYGG